MASQRLRTERRTDAEDLDRFSVALVREILDEVLVLKEPSPAATIGSDGRGLVCALSVIHYGFAFGPAHGAELWQRNSTQLSTCFPKCFSGEVAEWSIAAVLKTNFCLFCSFTISLTKSSNSLFNKAYMAITYFEMSCTKWQKKAIELPIIAN